MIFLEKVMNSIFFIEIISIHQFLLLQSRACDRIREDVSLNNFRREAFNKSLDNTTFYHHKKVVIT